MARYIVLRVESNKTAETLLERFAPVKAINVVGLFVAVTEEKRCKCPTPPTRIIRSTRWGTTHCPECKLPYTSVRQHPRNLLNDEDLHPRFNDLDISVWEPFFGDPVKKYGAELIQRKKDQVAAGAVRLKRHKARKRREARREGN
jgi:hypothetical protein